LRELISSNAKKIAGQELLGRFLELLRLSSASHGVTLIQLLGEVLCISFSFIAEVTLVIEG
jgi:hypothetical protein